MGKFLDYNPEQVYLLPPSVLPLPLVRNPG